MLACESVFLTLLVVPLYCNAHTCETATFTFFVHSPKSSPVISYTAVYPGRDLQNGGEGYSSGVPLTPERVDGGGGGLVIIIAYRNRASSR